MHQHVCGCQDGAAIPTTKDVFLGLGVTAESGKCQRVSEIKFIYSEYLFCRYFPDTYRSLKEVSLW